MASPKQAVLALCPKAKCTKSYTGKVTIDLGQVMYDRLTHQNKQVFTFSYGTAADCWQYVLDSITN